MDLVDGFVEDSLECPGVECEEVGGCMLDVLVLDQNGRIDFLPRYRIEVAVAVKVPQNF